MLSVAPARKPADMKSYFFAPVRDPDSTASSPSSMHRLLKTNEKKKAHRRDLRYRGLRSCSDCVTDNVVRLRIFF